MRPRPCGCKGCRTCLICETEYGADKIKLEIVLDKENSYVYCPFCNKGWTGWDMDLYKQHPYHDGECIDFPGVYIQPNFITETEEKYLMKNIDEMPWDQSQSGRRKQNFGPKTNFKKNKIVTGNFRGFPLFSKFLQDKFETIDLLQGFETIEQCSLEYDPSKGASIDPHIDDCWIWGERIGTVNMLSDSVLTMTYFDNYKKYNLMHANEYGPIISCDGQVNMNNQDWDISALEATKPKIKVDSVIRIPMPRRSLLILYGESRYHWEHCVLREDIKSRRVCIAYREFTPPYMPRGCHEGVGSDIRKKAKQFWDHRHQ